MVFWLDALFLGKLVLHPEAMILSFYKPGDRKSVV